MKKIIIITVLLVTFSCSSIKEIKGKQFSYSSPNRELFLSFENDSLCSIKNVFHCDDIDNKYKEITIKAIYKRQSNMIIIRNVTCKDNTCKFPPNIDIPIQISNKCLFLNKENRNGKEIFDGRKYQSDYQKYGLVPNIDIDTMYIYKNKITLVKKIENGNFGFIFKNGIVLKKNELKNTQLSLLHESSHKN